MRDLTELYQRRATARAELATVANHRDIAYHAWSGSRDPADDGYQAVLAADRELQKAARELHRIETGIRIGLLRNAGAHGAAAELEKAILQEVHQ